MACKRILDTSLCGLVGGARPHLGRASFMQSLALNQLIAPVTLVSGAISGMHGRTLRHVGNRKGVWEAGSLPGRQALHAERKPLIICSWCVQGATGSLNGLPLI